MLMSFFAILQLQLKVLAQSEEKLNNVWTRTNQSHGIYNNRLLLFIDVTSLRMELIMLYRA